MGSQILQQLIADLRQSAIEVALARLESDRAQQAARRTGLIDKLGTSQVFRSVEDAVRAHRAQPQIVPGRGPDTGSSSSDRRGA